MKDTLKNRTLGGFTIIEVMIVLAIAGLIMVIVFLAIPQLQRSQRNNARQAVMNRISTEVNNFASNNNGNIPTVAEFNSSPPGAFYTRYISNNASSFTDPTSGATMVFQTWTSDTLNPAPPPTGNLGQVKYQTGRLCAGEASTTTGANGRNFIVMTVLEGGAIYCLDNG